jgi:uncharacterized protein YdgA (DUF945 family)
MSTRTRFCLFAAAAILLAYPLAAWIVGFIVQEQLQANEQVGLQQAGPYFSMLEHSYSRGVFGATEVITVGIDAKRLNSAGLSAFGRLSVFRLTARNTISHGPFPRGRPFALATIDTELVLPVALQKRLDALFAGRKPYALHTTLGWRGGQEVEFSSPAFSGTVAAGTLISSGGMTGTATGTRDRRSMTLDFTAKSFGASSDKFQAQLDDVRVKSVQQRAFGTVNLGDASITISHLEAHGKAPEKPPLSVQNLEITSHSSPTGDYISYDGKVATGPVQVARFTATQELYELGVTHVYGPALAALQDTLRAAGSAASNPQSQQRLLEALRRDGTGVLLHNPVIEIRHFDFATPEGALTLSASVAAPGLRREDLEGSRPVLIAALIQHLQAKADVRIDTGVLDELTEGTPGNGDRLATAARQLEAQGYIAHEGTALVAHLKFDHGKLSLNGKTFPPARPGPQP